MKTVSALLTLVISRSSLVFIILISLFTIHYSLFTNSVHAEEPCQYDPAWTDQEAFNAFNNCAIDQDVYGAETFTGAQIWATVDGLNMQLFGLSALHPETNESTAGRGALAYASNLVAGLYANPPASGVQYFAQQIHKFNPVQPAYAQAGTTGFDALSPVQSLWTVFRNASYVGFVIVFVIIGFMVMFRAHISPQAVATVQDSIPRIVIALILVTFSYAIAGLMIDLMFVVINLVINLLGSATVNGVPIIQTPKAQSVIFDKSILGVITGAWTDIFKTSADAIGTMLTKVITGGDFLGLLKFTLGGIGGLIVGIAALFIMFRILIMLLMAYVMIIVLTLAAPFYFLIQALPGNNGAKEWFKQMAANIAVFPAVSLMIILAGVIGGIEAFGGTGAGELTKQATDQAVKFPLLAGGLPANAIGKLIAIGFLFMTPEVGNMVKKAMKVEGGPSFAGAGAALGAGAGVAYTGSGLRAGVGMARGAFQAAGQATQEDVGTRLPGRFGKALRERRERMTLSRP